VRPATGSERSPVTVRVHVHARGEIDGARHALVAEATIQPPPT
jgi:hypothetical protein